MNKKLIFVSAVLFSVFTLSACDNSGGEYSIISPSPSPVPPDPAPNPPTPPEPDSPCAGKKYAHALSALKKRDASMASEHELIDYSLCVLDLQMKNPLREEAVNLLYQGMGDSFSWNPGGYSHLFRSTMPAKTFSLLGVNSEEKLSIYSLLMAGEQNGQRYMTLAQNPLVVDEHASGDSDKNAWMKNLFNWLLQQESSNKASYQLAGQDNGKINIVISHMKDGRYFNALKSWMDKYWPDTYTLNENGNCDAEHLTECLQSQPVDLLIIGDNDTQQTGYDGIKKGLDYASQNKIPLLTIPSEAEINPILKGVYQRLGITAVGNYGAYSFAKDFPIAELRQPGDSEKYQAALLQSLNKGQFNADTLTGSDETPCSGSVINCDAPAFMDAFRRAADDWRNALISLDIANIDALANAENYPVLASNLLLADKYRQLIDYPISAKEDGGSFLKAMFADWMVAYGRSDNLPQPDLGEYVAKSTDVAKGTASNFIPQPPSDDQRTFTIPSSNQSTISGWFIPAGRTVTLSSTKDSAAVVLQLGFEFTDGYKSARDKILVAPSEASLKDVNRLTLAPGESRTFSTPYGAPLYIRFVDDKRSSATITAHGVSEYSAITDINDSASITNFEQQISNGSEPYVDIHTDGIEIHLRKYLFTDALKDQSNIDAGITNTSTLIKALSNYYIWNHTLGGFKVQGESLAQSLPEEELRVCSALWGSDCTDEELNTRPIIQHINYTPHGTCDWGCSGNPIQAAWAILPYGWGESHEQGHNLQQNKLNVQYVSEEDKESWSAYNSRAGENSNNIFPYHTLWMSTFGQGKTEPVRDDHYDPLDIYAVAMSELRGMKDNTGSPIVYSATCEAYQVDGVVANRYTAPWQSNDYAIYNSYRMGFYIQMMLQSDKQKMRDGTTLENGFNIYTLLYQSQRIFDKYSKDEQSWVNHRDSLGFSEFPWKDNIIYGGKNVQTIPGNDFMLVSLSFITNADWRPYFDMFGLHYTNLASQQVDTNGFDREVGGKILVNKFNSQYLPNKQLSQDPDFISIDLTDKNSSFPGQNWKCGS